MRILISGAGGLVGSALTPALAAAGHEVARLVRRPASAENEVSWDPARGELDAAALDGFDAVVHLAGESIAGRWGERRKARILTSRVDGTRLLAETLAAAQSPPVALICASAIGFYGDRGEKELDEESASGDGFLAEVCRRWESAADAARERARVVHLRLGMVLSAHGGALGKMLPPFRFGLGGVVGSGSQWVSWIAIDDLTAAVIHLLGDASLVGPVNLVASRPVTQRALTETLGRVLRRPTLVPMPAPVVWLAFGEMGRELLLASTRVVPRQLLESGFDFRFPELEDALRHELA